MASKAKAQVKEEAPDKEAEGAPDPRCRCSISTTPASRR